MGVSNQPSNQPPGTQLRVGEAIIDLLAREYGVDVVFGIPGVHNIELYRGLHRSGVRAISPRHEQGAGFMADGWSIVNGRPGVCVLISGPGITNVMTPIAQAYHDSRPMFVLASTTPTNALGKSFGPLHDLPDQAALARSVCAFSETVTDPLQLPALIERAWNIFTSARPRPVHIAIPMDVLEQSCEPFTRVNISAAKPVAEARDINRAIEILNSALDPVIIAGGGAIAASTQLIALAEILDAPVLLTGNAKGVVPSSHRLCAGNCLVFGRVQRDIEAADVVIVVGTELSDTDLYNNGRALNLAGKIVRIDIDHEQLTRRTTPTVGLVGDAAQTLQAIISRLKPRAQTNGETRARTWREHARAKTNKVFVPWLTAIEAELPSNAIVALDSTQLAYSAHWWLPAVQSRSWLAPYGFGTLGCALPMAIGASVAAPSRPVLVIAGDGGWLFTVAEMAAAKDLNCKIVFVLWDNSGYEQIRDSFDDVKAPQMGVDVSSHDPLMIARGFGWSASEVTTPEQLSVTLRDAFGRTGPQFIRVQVK
ncbi:probable 2-ketoarginine decarboxylase AruI [Acidimicrobiaceae bacterium]|nr:probable 2-ketoarginine decarboxylase AruI [Acidimicrobiaceae bacterium]